MLVIPVTPKVLLTCDAPVVVIPAKVGLAVVCKFWGLDALTTLPATDITKPFVDVNVKVSPPEIAPVPVVPARLMVVLIPVVDAAVIRPYASVVITGIAVLLPYVFTPGPTTGMFTVIAPVAALTVRLPPPLELNPVTPVLVIVIAWFRALVLIPVPAAIDNDWLVRETDPVPVPPAIFKVELTVAVLNALMRPYASVVIIGIAVLLPVVAAPGP